MKRNFQADFLIPATWGLGDADKQRVAVALDAAILFGTIEALSYAAATETVAERTKSLNVATKLYAEKVKRLAALGSDHPRRPSGYGVRRVDMSPAGLFNRIRRASLQVWRRGEFVYVVKRGDEVIWATKLQNPEKPTLKARFVRAGAKKKGKRS